MASIGSIAAYAITMSAAVGLAVALPAQSALGEVQAHDLREADIDDLLTAGVRLEQGAAYVRQLHISDEGEVYALTLGVGAPSPWIGLIAPDRPVSILAEEAMYSLSTGDIVVMARADDLVARPADQMPLARPVAVSAVAPASVFGAEVVGGPFDAPSRVAEVLGGRQTERLRIQSVGFNGEPMETAMVPADCARFTPITRRVDLSACEV